MINKKLKKSLAMFIVGANILSCSAMTALADPDEQIEQEVVKPSATDRASIVISGVEPGATVKAYQVIAAQYNDYGIYGYAQTTASKKVQEIGKGKDAETKFETIEDYEVTNLGKWCYEVAGGTATTKPKDSDVLTLSYDATTKNYYTNNAEAGAYIVIVITSNKEYIYNPMIVANAYADSGDASTLGKYVDKDDKATNGKVNISLDENGDPIEGNTLETSTTLEALTAKRQGFAYAKKSPVEFNKHIVDASTNLWYAEDSAIGDTIVWDVNCSTPDYSEAFFDISYYLTDTQCDGLSLLTTDNFDKIVTVEMTDEGEKETTIDPKYYTLTIPNKVDDPATDVVETWSWRIDFDSDWLKANPRTDILVEYHSDLTEDALILDNKNLDAENPNKATLEYQTLPNGEMGHREKDMPVYTFTINQAIKVGEDGAITVDEDGTVKAVKEPLAGATFELTGVTDRNGKDISSKVYTMTTDADGVIKYEGLDEGTYTLVETDAPDGFFLIDTQYTVEIEATYRDFEDADNQDFLRTEYEYYTVSIENNDTHEKAVSTYYNPKYVDYVEEQEGIEINSVTNGVGLVNTHLTKLPSTGGNGTLVFSIVGGMMFVGGGVIVIKSRRKAEKAE